MAQLSYTTTDAIRAAIGLTVDEVPDQMLQNQGLEKEINLDLDSWLPGHSSLTTEPAVSYLSLYAQWYAAEQVLKQMLLAIPQMIGDGKSEMRRFLNMKVEELYPKASEKRALYKRLLEQDQSIQQDLGVPTLMSASRPDYDPVTNS